jgi:hypothetical protein
MRYTINTSTRNIASGKTTEERTVFRVIGTDRDGNASIVGQYKSEEEAQGVIKELEALDDE